MKEIFKPVPNIDDLIINQDGTVIYYQDKQIKITEVLVKKTGKKYKRIKINCKYYSVSRLVFSAFVGELPRYRDVKFKDGNQLNTNYKNLLPHHKESLLSTEFMPVKGLNNVFINSTGTEIYQDNYSVNIRVIISNNKEYLMCTLNTNKLSQNFYISNLVAFAWLNWNGKGHIIYIDNNTKNNFYKNLKILSVQEYKKHNSILLNRKIKR